MLKVAEMKSWLLALILLVLGGEAAVQDHSYSTPPVKHGPALYCSTTALKSLSHAITAPPFISNGLWLFSTYILSPALICSLKNITFIYTEGLRLYIAVVNNEFRRE